MSRSKQSKGGKAVKSKTPPAKCPHPGCKKSNFASWHAYLGHLSVHKFSENRGLTYDEGAFYFGFRHLAEIEADANWKNGAWLMAPNLVRIVERIREMFPEETEKLWAEYKRIKERVTK